MKQLFNTSLLFLFTVVFIYFENNFIKKEDKIINKIEKSSLSFLPEIETSIILKKEDIQLSDFKNNIQNSNITIDYETAIIYKINFKKLPTLTGIFVKGLAYGRINKDVFFVHDTKSKINLLIEREMNGFVDQKNGYISIRDEKRNLLFNNEIVNNRFSNQNDLSFFRQNTSAFTIKNIKSSKAWNCSEEEFNALYQEAKLRCEDDWLCDIACSINPCFIAYLAFAVGKCSGLIK
jgi:hypothetical protein